MRECFKCKNSIRGESGISCAGVCGKHFHTTIKCSGLEQYSSGILDTNPMIKFICEDCILYIHNVDLVLKDMQEVVNRNGNYLKEYKNEFEISLQKNEIEIKKLLEAIEERYAKRLNAMKIAQETCEKSVIEIKKMSAFSDAFKSQSEKICNNVKEIKNDIRSEMKKIKESTKSATKPQMNFAEQLKQTVYIKPKTRQENAKTTKEIKEKIDPSSLSLKVDKISNRNEGAIAINCIGEESVQKIESEVKQKLGEKYDVKIITKKRPQIMITDMSEMWKSEELEVAIKKQNNLNGTVKCVKVFKNKNRDVHSAIVELEMCNYKQIIEKKKINIGWEKCRVFEHLNLNRCYKCWGYHHVAKNCKNCIKCAKCGENHDTRECSSAILKCVNCARYNDKFKLNLDISHDSRDVNCAVYKKLMESEKNKNVC